jgi:hypothetical protein
MDFIARAYSYELACGATASWASANVAFGWSGDHYLATERLVTVVRQDGGNGRGEALTLGAATFGRASPADGPAACVPSCGSPHEHMWVPDCFNRG